MVYISLISLIELNEKLFLKTLLYLWLGGKFSGLGAILDTYDWVDNAMKGQREF